MHWPTTVKSTLSLPSISLSLSWAACTHICIIAEGNKYGEKKSFLLTEVKSDTETVRFPKADMHMQITWDSIGYFG